MPWIKTIEGQGPRPESVQRIGMKIQATSYCNIDEETMKSI